MKITFSCKFDYPGQAESSVFAETSSENLADVVESFRAFLLAAGFHHENVVDFLGPAP